MTAEECNQRAAICAESASLAASEPVALEFMRLAAQWRAMAMRVIVLDHTVDPAPALDAVNFLTSPSH